LDQLPVDAFEQVYSLRNIASSMAETLSKTEQKRTKNAEIQEGVKSEFGFREPVWDLSYQLVFASFDDFTHCTSGDRGSDRQMDEWKKEQEPNGVIARVRRWFTLTTRP
jgi:hypothetical protein